MDCCTKFKKYYYLNDPNSIEEIKKLFRCPLLSFELCGYHNSLEWDCATGLSSFAGARKLDVTKLQTSCNLPKDISRNLIDEYIYVSNICN